MHARATLPTALLLTALASTLCLAAPETPGPTPGPTLAGRMEFVETDSAGRVMRELSVVFTDQPAKTCLSGDWRQARGVKGTKGFPKEPVYRLEDGKLELLLVNGVCDSYDSYIGRLTHQSFQGEHVAYGLGFNKSLNAVNGVYSSK